MNQTKKINNITIGRGHKLSFADCHETARNMASVSLGKTARRPMNVSRKILFAAAKDFLLVYGLNTQFGGQANFIDHREGKIFKEYLLSLRSRQEDLVISHDCGLGENAPNDTVRATMLLRAHCLGLGYSGVRPQAVEALLLFLNKNIYPIIPKQGSVGASGDLLPLAAVANALQGRGRVVFKDREMSALNAMRRVGIKPFEFEMREGLALINGTSFMTASAALALYDVNRLFNQMLSAIGMTLESLLVFDSAYHSFVHGLKGHKGEIAVANFMTSFWKGSKLIKNLDKVRRNAALSSKDSAGAYIDSLPQDYYSVRSVPHGFGPMHENIKRVSEWVENEINSVNDNPVIDPNNKKIYHTANFMGYYITDAADIIKIDIAQSSSWIHALVANLVHPRKNSGLPANLISRPDTYSGFRPLQILSASIAVQNRKLAQSQQAYMLPTEGDNQDVNSLGTHAALDLRYAVENLERLTAILFIAACQALEFRGLVNAGKKSRSIYGKIREVSKTLRRDRSLSPDIRAVIQLMRDRKI